MLFFKIIVVKINKNSNIFENTWKKVKIYLKLKLIPNMKFVPACEK